MICCAVFQFIHALIYATDHKTLRRYGPGRPTFLGDFTDPPPYLKGEFPGASPYPCTPARQRGGGLLWCRYQAVNACCLYLFRVQTCVQPSTELTIWGHCTGDYGWDTQVRLCAHAFSTQQLRLLLQYWGMASVSSLLLSAVTLA